MSVNNHGNPPPSCNSSSADTTSEVLTVSPDVDSNTGSRVFATTILNGPIPLHQILSTTPFLLQGTVLTPSIAINDSIMTTGRSLHESFRSAPVEYERMYDVSRISASHNHQHLYNREVTCNCGHTSTDMATAMSTVNQSQFQPANRILYDYSYLMYAFDEALAISSSIDEVLGNNAEVMTTSTPTASPVIHHRRRHQQSGSRRNNHHSRRNNSNGNDDNSDRNDARQ